MSDSTERNCDKCIHHTSGNCDSWDCKMQTVEDVKKEAVNEYVKSVVEELEERTDFLKDCTKYGNKNANQQTESYSTMMMYEVAGLVEYLIEIVKHGCVDDDVCEWKYNDSEYYFESSCDHLHIFMPDGPKENEYDFCPYCGKKIKVVE